jgi:predicted nuclease with TOPRIM domain
MSEVTGVDIGTAVTGVATAIAALTAAAYKFRQTIKRDARANRVDDAKAEGEVDFVQALRDEVKQLRGENRILVERLIELTAKVAALDARLEEKREQVTDLKAAYNIQERIVQKLIGDKNE